MNRYAILDIVLSSYSWAKRSQLAANKEGKDHVSSRGIPGALGQTGKGRGDGNDKRVQVAESAGLQVCRRTPQSGQR